MTRTAAIFPPRHGAWRDARTGVEFKPHETAGREL